MSLESMDEGYLMKKKEDMKERDAIVQQIVQRVVVAVDDDGDESLIGVGSNQKVR